ncbi:MAG: hypothetical protein ACI4WY_12590 [Anaerovoracaceae bacterium]
MKKKLTVLATAFFAVTLACWFHSPSEFSQSERRQLAQFPEMTVEAVLSGQFASEFESYSLDQFPLRDQFRSLKAVTEYGILQKKDNNDLYLKDGYVAQILYPLSEKSVLHATERFRAVYDKYLSDSEGRIFISVIPDKGYYLASDGGWPALDYDRLFELVASEMDYAAYVDLTDELEAEDYYKTDSHWRQESLTHAAAALGDAMGIAGDLKKPEDMEVVTAAEDFRGVYYGQAALPLPGEPLRYVTWDGLEDCTVYNFETNETAGVYQMEKLEDRDPYDIFLGGACALMTVENPSAQAAGIDRELILFRDSFGSSMAPLLLPAYSRVTLVDLRYLKSDFLDQFIDFHGQDVLFLYGTTLLNESYTLK